MGLAASQAKLLSITTRLSDNELRSQTLTAAKMALSNQTSAASKKYINALNSTELLYGTYDMNGNKTTIALTGTALSEYAPLKNQYALINSSGQVLVSETQAKYYEKSENINDYLAFNGVDRIDTGETRTVTNPDYEDAYNKWKEDYDKWKNSQPDKQIYAGEKVIQEAYDEPGTPAWTERVHTSEIYEAVMSTGCIGYALGDQNCYMHVLASLLGAGDHTTTSGVTYHIYEGNDRCEDGYYWCWNTDRHPVAQSLKDELKTLYPCGEVHDETVDICMNGQLLKKDVYCKDEYCDPTKTLYQKLVDLLWDVHDDYCLGSGTGGSATRENIARFWHFVEFDLDEATIIEHEAVPGEHHDAITEPIYEDNPAWQEWYDSEPPMTDVPPTIDEIIYEYNDADKAQWYVNLWHRMNGASDTKDGNQTTSSTNTTGFWNEMIHNETTTTTQRWAVLEDGLMNSSKWLQNALTQGTVTLEQVQFTGESTESNTGLKDVSWKSIIYSSAQDITEQTDETAIAKAEAEYERAQNDIEAKDKQFDNMLKLLDTEHEALQTEYESVQQVINKNISRTLKIYSA